jgi:alpha-galactosidase
LWQLHCGVINFLKRIKNNILSIVNPAAAEKDTVQEASFGKLSLSYKAVQGKKKLNIPGDCAGPLSVSIDSFGGRAYGTTFSLSLKYTQPEIKAELIDLSIEICPAFPNDSLMMVNGFQSWSRSEEMGRLDRVLPLLSAAKPFLAACGDRNIYRQSGKPGRFHSWTYTYFRFPDDRVFFAGSLSEKSGYTVFNYDFSSGILKIRKDCQGSFAQDGSELLNLYIGFGDLDTLMGEYAELSGHTRPLAPKINGWCSWYNYYTSVSEEIVLANLGVLKSSKLPLDCFQIDDGWQQAIGDWLSPNLKFPSGMKMISSKIKAAGFRPGLWLAPLICVPSSVLYRENPSWLLRDQRGRPVKAGFNPGWEGFFYALDFYAPGVQEYLGSVLDKVQNEWGYSMLKLDFLYAAALVPGKGRSRGQIMSEVVDFIDQHTRNSIILGCGVPLGPSFGRFDYCRIGSDVGPDWQDYLRLLGYPERVSTENSLTSTIGRRHLDGRMFRNDPDVYILRDGVKGVNENRLDNHQRHTLFFLNNLLGGLIFFSDHFDELSGTQQRMLRSSFPRVEAKVTGFESYRKLYIFEFSIEGKKYLAYCNLSSQQRTVKLPSGLWFSHEYFLTAAGTNLVLEPYQSISFYQARQFNYGPLSLLGSTGHLFPGAQVETVQVRGREIEIALKEHSSAETVIYLAVPAGIEPYHAGGLSYDLLSYEGVTYIAVPLDGSQEATR